MRSGWSRTKHAFRSADDTPTGRSKRRVSDQGGEGIQIENNAVATDDRYVKVAFLGPLTVSHDKDTLSTTPLNEILFSLEGSYTALYRRATHFGGGGLVVSRAGVTFRA